MSKAGDIEPDPSVIGNIAKPPFVRLPDSRQLFTDRAQRFRALADGHELASYLLFLADLSQAQADIQSDLPEPEMPAAETRARAKAHSMPPLDRGRFTADAAFDVAFERLTAAAEPIDMPAPAREALTRLKHADATIPTMVRNVLDDAIPIESMAEHVFVAAALQVHFARLAQRLDAAQLVPVGDGVCPACGAAPVASLVVGWQNADGTRFCSCSLCGTLWNFVRVRCTVCGKTDKITYQEISGGNGQIKAEVCETCGSYSKVLYQQKNAVLDPVADDVASLGLDLLVRELGFRRGNVNPFLLGY
ncbi:MAG: formate dehydrogenase accessory protein FdhE [Pseudorhodoplanes sp.]|nr:Protein FdhE [Pseudorhodoplanes sp.]MBW7950284.1 formate dehydrogenase accessory protein FdhE [Pseudorhodoplanes sp.]MCL4711071.1 formate dehydrogenase accessory protein FdhE [Pseudorhodoplanes sp.]GIK82100.1 MAG: protein FdhE [Alphaproteobacteria bacterium]